MTCEGKLYYRGYDIEKVVAGFVREKRFGFEETIYLLLFGNLPTAGQLADFKQVLNKYRTLPTNFVRDIIMKAPTQDMMNTLARSVLTLYAYDEKANGCQEKAYELFAEVVHDYPGTIFAIYANEEMTRLSVRNATEYAHIPSYIEEEAIA